MIVPNLIKKSCGERLSDGAALFNQHFPNTTKQNLDYEKRRKLGWFNE
jgi:hypothetical protein